MFQMQQTRQSHAYKKEKSHFFALGEHVCESQQSNQRECFSPKPLRKDSDILVLFLAWDEILTF